VNKAAGICSRASLLFYFQVKPPVRQGPPRWYSFNVPGRGLCWFRALSGGRDQDGGRSAQRLSPALRPGNERQQIHADASVSSAGNVTSSSSRSDVASDSVYASPSGKVMLSSGARR